MLKINDKYRKKNNNKNKLENEVLMGIIVCKYLYGEDLWLGDDNSEKKLSDLRNKDYSYGFEIVRCEIEIDHMGWVVSKKLEQNEYMLNDSSKNELEKITSSNYFFDCSKNGEVRLYGPSISGNLEDIFRRNIKNKLEKISKGNYSDCTKTALVISTIDRARNEFDANVVFKIYQECCNGSKEKFDDVFLVTTSGIYSVGKERVNVKKLFSDEEFSVCVREMKKCLGLERNGGIY